MALIIQAPASESSALSTHRCENAWRICIITDFVDGGTGDGALENHGRDVELLGVLACLQRVGVA